MENNYSQRPRKRITRETARKRQLAALAVIALLVLIIIIVFFKACAKDDAKDNGKTKTSNASTTTTTTTVQNTLAIPTTTTAPATEPGPNDSGFVLDKQKIYLKVGESDMPYVTGYPEGTSEADEVWKSSDEKIASVDKIGNITAVAPGECYITLSSAKDPTKEIQVKVVVSDNGLSTTSNSATSETTTTASGITQTSNKTTTTENKTTTPQPLNAAEAPAPKVINNKDLTYKDGILIANKSYALPSDFNPGLDPLCASQFQKLSNAAAEQGLSLYIGSGFRSYSDQNYIYNNYVSVDGKEKADTYSARPGHSEHQTGLAIDCNTIDDAFGETKEAEFIAEHAHEFGFIIRYPKGKESITGYKYEPWHLRYLGTETATKVYESGLTLEEYLGIDSKYN